MFKTGQDKTRLIQVFVMIAATLSVMAQNSIFSNLPQTVDYRDATITDVGVVATDIYQWEVTDETTGKIDTVYTTQEYILWESDGDIELQAEAIRAEGLSRAKKAAVNTEFREGSLKDGWLCNFSYYVFKYDYPSVNADGNDVRLSAIGACPTIGGCKEVRDVVIGTHITITANRECPSSTTKGFDTQDWGVLMSLAAGPKIKLGWKSNLFFLGIGMTGFGAVTNKLWLGLTISTEMASSEPSNNYNLVIMPDYEGYGISVSSAHPYLYQELTARQVIDATRYGIALYNYSPATDAIRHPIRSNFRTISCGYSQGGSVALATHRFIEQNGLVDELHFVGSICGDGPYDPMATLMFYMEQDLAGKPMKMPVVLPLIVKGMLDSNPYMKFHKTTDYFTQEFLDTGIMKWLTDKQLNTDQIAALWKQMGQNGQTTVFDSNGNAMMHDIMTPECYNYFKDIYLNNKDTYKTAGVPMPSRRGVNEDLHYALASNDMTEGWTPQHAILLFHSNSDNVVPYANAERAKAKFGDWAVLHTSKLGHDHVDSGTDFFQSDSYFDLAMSLDLRTFMAKHRLCNLPWNGQTTNNIPTSW